MTHAAGAVANALAEPGRSAPERFYRRVLEVLQQRDVPHLVGGAYALAHHTHVPYATRDFDVFLRRADVGRACQSLEDAGYRAAVVYPHFLGKVRDGARFVDLIFGSGNGIVPVDDRWFTRASSGTTLGLPVRFCSAEDVLWSKAFIMERERYDGGDVAHLLLATADRLDWAYLVERFGDEWRVLLAHLVLFGFIYPGRRSRIPADVIDTLVERLRREAVTPGDGDNLCRGSLLSRRQYLLDLNELGMRDARLTPDGAMTREEIDKWTEAAEVAE
jgi:hypothetical protein